MVTCGGLIYGSVMGSYGAKPLQACYSALKVPLLLVVATFICLPSFYVVNALLGFRDDFAAAFRGVMAAQATLAVVLSALAPFTVVFYLSVERYRTALLFNGLPFALATVAGQAVLGRHYRPLVTASPRHRIGKFFWIAAYIFVAVQMARVLRPFVGAPNLEVSFFRDGAWNNAYVQLARMIWNAFSG